MRCGARLNSKNRSGHVMSGFVCGLDVHKGCCDATKVDWFGNVVESRRISRDVVYSFLSSRKVSLVAMFIRCIVDMGLEVLVAHPRKTRLIAENRLKGDGSDSKCLAELARLGALPSSYIPAGDVAGMRELVRRRAFLVGIRTRVKNRIIATLAPEGIETPRDFKLFTRSGLDWLKSLRISSIDQSMRPSVTGTG
ncbi:hypothetical protein HRbin01_00261 [archaeon HR01]|nr:hypothetical protein HRbin01_00261 [archaeon HR01]